MSFSKSGASVAAADSLLLTGCAATRAVNPPNRIAIPMGSGAIFTDQFLVTGVGRVRLPPIVPAFPASRCCLRKDRPPFRHDSKIS